ncbi:dnaJ homolog subfamily B member 13 [Calliphora vicina]|uniref:dnaJ homolog subfamily B member 13 n=1 Tax=Calliphora vicina TaxID=7373 RepID=UPI00325BB232
MYINLNMNISELDYYAILDVKRNANKEEITLAYRRLAVRLCPFRDPKHQRDFVPLSHESQLTHMSPLPLNRQWNYINMAFDVLGNDLYRAIYDRYGEAGLFQGIHLPNGYFPPYQYHGNHMKVYHGVFGSYSPYANVIDALTAPPPLCSNKGSGIGVRIKDKAVEKVVELTLEEVYNGCLKIMQVWRQEFTDKEETRTEKRKKILTLNIEPGVTAGTRYCFKEEGDRSPTTIPADIIFIVVDKPHNTFRRDGFHNLVYTLKIDLCQALTGFQFVINSLDKRQLKVCVNDVVKPGYTKVLPCEGLPKCKPKDASLALKPKGFQSKEYGDLIIEFKTTFPDYFNKEMKRCVRNLFADLEAMKKVETDKKIPPN